MKIAISGKPGSGKTTVGKLLAKELNYKHYSVGDLRGQMAQERGLTIDELNKLGETEDWTDKEADKRSELIGKEQDNFVIDGWMAFHFIPDAVKIFLEVEYTAAAERVFKDQRPDEQHHETVEGVKEMLKARYNQSKERYQKYYQVDIDDKNHYSLVIDTTNLSIQAVLEQIMEFLKNQPKSL